MVAKSSKPNKRKRLYGSDHPVSLSMNFLLDAVSIIGTFNNVYPDLLTKEKESSRLIKINEQKVKRILKALEKNPVKGKKPIRARPDMKLLSELFNTRNLMRRQSKIRRSSTAFKSSIFVHIFSRFDAFILDIVRHYYSSSDLLMKSDKQLTYAEIAELGSHSFKQIKRRYVDEEIEKLRDNRMNQLKLIADQSKYDLLKQISNFIPLFIEASERRNIIVHHRGAITNRYRKNLEKYGIQSPPKDQTSLLITEEYITQVFETLLNIALEVSLAVNKSKKTNEKLFEAINNDIIVEAIRDELYPLALTTLDFVYKHGFDFDIYVLNKALCYKRMGNKQEYQAISKLFIKINDNPILQMAICILNDSPEGALRIMRSVKNKNQLEHIELTINDSSNLLFEEFAHTTKFRLNDYSPQQK